MNYAALTPSVDVFEALLAVVLLVAWVANAYNARASWSEKEWSIDDTDPVMRRLGSVRYDNARLLFLIVICFTVIDFLLMLVPSAIQSQEDTTPVMVAIGARVGLIVATLALIHKVLNDAWWRRYSERHREVRARELADAVAVARELKAALLEHKVAIAEATAAVERNIGITKDAVTRATEAYKEANNVNLAIKNLGQGLKDVQAVQAATAVEAASAAVPPKAAEASG